MSLHQTLEKVRKPRIHIKYDVETDGKTVEKELPFVVGVMGDFSGNNPEKPIEPLNERDFLEIDTDNFDDIMRKISPGLTLRVQNALNEDDSELSINLKFNSMKDFEPERLVQQVDALRKLKNMRDHLRDLLTQADRSYELEQILEETLTNPQALTQLASDLSAQGDQQ